MRYVIFVVLLGGLAGCASLSETECQSGDWYGIGLADGAAGRSADFIYQHAKACNEFGIAPKASPWRKGRAEGLKQYCTPTNAYRLGSKGRRLSAVCPGEISALERANFRGLRWHDITRDIRDIEGEISTINARLADLPDGDPARSSLVSERSFLRLDLLGLRAERARYRY